MATADIGGPVQGVAFSVLQSVFMKPYYITTTIPYVNAEPHVGFALEVVQTDALARFRRLMGHDVFYNAGTDEHGQKIWEKAREAGEDVQTYVDRYAESVKKLKDTLNLSYDHFIRTTDEHHKKAAQELWKRCEQNWKRCDQNGDIYKKKYKGLYCVGCEKFLTERDMVDGKCSIHPNLEPVELEEENYFFRLSKYQHFLEEYLSRPDVIVPLHRLKEARNFVEAGLEDFSISREKEKLPWGVPVPGDDAQVMYVWFDALTNYISTLGWPEDASGNYKKFWEGGYKIQMAGKDQIRFQSIMWPAMLRSAGLPAPESVFYHGFITSGGQKMSKSLGNVINPLDLVEKYGTDATRYLLLRHVHSTEDTDITWERLDEWYEANLVNGLGNLVARVMKMSESSLETAIDPSCVEKEGFDHEGSVPVRNALNQFEFQKALDLVWSDVAAADGLIQETMPFKLAKSDDADEVKKAKEAIKVLVRKLAVIAFYLRPMLPKTAKAIEDAIKQNKKPDNLFPRL